MTSRRNWKLYLWSAVLGLCLNGVFGCGYTLVGAPPSGSATRIAIVVPPVLNQAREPGLEHRMTAALRRAVVQHPRLYLASDVLASHHLQGTVKRFQVFAVSFDESDNVVQYRIESVTRIRLVQRDAEAPALEQEISAWTEYLVSPSGSVRENVAARTAAIHRLAEQFADKCTALIDVALL
jgi:hypothetical protein